MISGKNIYYKNKFKRIYDANQKAIINSMLAMLLFYN